MEELLSTLKQDYPGLVFTLGSTHCWSPEKGQIFYTIKEHRVEIAGLLHELGHARLKHQSYGTDVDLLKKEVAAWQEASLLARHYGAAISKDHIEDCLDTYRDWLHKRSTCPACKASGVQVTPRRYHCVNCGERWTVSQARFCRPYRLRTITKK